MVADKLDIFIVTGLLIKSTPLLYFLKLQANMHSRLLNCWIKACILLTFFLNSPTSLYSQESQPNRELDEAFNNAKNAHYEIAIPVLKKYAEIKGLDDFNALEINIYLNLSYLATKNKALDVKRVNALADSYFANYGISKTDTGKCEIEMQLLYIASIINGNVGNNQKKVIFLNLIKKCYEERNCKPDLFYSLILNSLTRGLFFLEEYKSAIETGQKAWTVNHDLFNDQNAISLELLDILFNSYNKINEPENAIEYLMKEIEIGKNFWGKNHPEYLNCLDKLALEYTNLDDYKNELLVYLQIVEIRKELLGDKHPDYLASLTCLLVCYMDLGDYKKALDINLYLVDVQKTVLGDTDPQYLTILNNLSIVYSELRNFNKAFEISQKVNELCKEKYGEKTLDYFKSLERLALAYFELGDYQKALDVDLQVVQLGKEVLGDNNKDYLNSLGKLAEVYSQIGDNKKALDIYLYLVDVQKTVLGDKDTQYLTSLSNLASQYSHLGDYQKAIEIDLMVVELNKEIFGEKNPDYLISLNNLATDYDNIGNYKKALEINQKVIESRKELLGEMNPDYLTSLANTSVIYKGMGEYLKALEINQNVVKLEKEILGEQNPIYLTSLNNLALLYSDLGDYQKSLEINQRVVEIRKQTLGENHPDYLMSLNNLASVYSHLGNYQLSLEINQKIIDLLKDDLGEKHPYYLTGLNNLAYYYSKLGNYQKSLDIDQKVVDIRKETLGENHPDYITSISNLALDNSNLKNYKKALEDNIKVEELSKIIFGEKHPYYLISLGNLAGAELDVSELDSAINHFVQMLNKTEERVTTYFSLMTEHQRELFWEQNSYSFSLFPKYLERVNSIHPDGTSDAYNFSLFSKGLLLNTTLDFDKLIAEKGTPEAITKFEELKLLRLEIQRLLEKPIAERYLNVDSLENIAQQKETELVKISKEYGDYTSNLKVTWKDVQANLQDKDVAIEFVEYPTLTDTVKYAALVLRKGWQYPKFIPLFRKDEIEGFIKQDKNRIYSSDDHIGKQLRNLIWTPLETVVSPADRVYFSPAGIIHQLAIENLPVDDSTTLGDRYQMYRLSSTKELVVSKKQETSHTAVLYGGLIYSLGIPVMEAESKKYEFEKSRNYLAMRGYQHEIKDKKGWEFLEGTKPEIDQISSMMRQQDYQVTEYTGQNGTEESFKSLSGKKEGIIHIATHGFFESIEESRKNPFMLQRMGDQQQERATVDPMLRSGMIMAGGNKAWLGEKIPENIEDGVLTAKEISRMDLRCTDLVVLSACKTGLGEVSSEGVFGLQRSFKRAGVHTLVMSLWEVNDKATMFIMTEFYSNLLSGKDKRAAFLEAKRKCKKAFPEPQNWAAFIMLD